MLSFPNRSSPSRSISQCAFLSLIACGLAIVWPNARGHGDEPRDEPAWRPLPDAQSVKNLRLKVSANGRYFVDQRGKPFFYLGDTCWLLFQRPNREEVEEYLKDRAAKGFTVIQAYVLRGLGRQHPDGNSSLLDAPPSSTAIRLVPTRSSSGTWTTWSTERTSWAS
jgi:hypothetical protein